MEIASRVPEVIEFAKTLNNTPWCDEYEKMISGMLYNAVVPDLEAARFKARKFMNKYNSYFPDNSTPASLTADREAMLKQVVGSIGKSPFIEPPINIDYGCNISIGDNFYSNFKQHLYQGFNPFLP
ncbi:hypothetical protein BHE90_015399 [Fusarium euwallaceae]|uniref:Maltose/galactoside acetyltransferase domain-containing protein n=1 Tax=Fusarium euwallaceae TaxID=1147111 RepID=A0A430L3C1_9HYPO|nr:hypothetical protein BHE90_015399 [Fusarium euwallaceae]